MSDTLTVGAVQMAMVDDVAANEDRAERLVREAGCEAYMSKPIQMSAFISEVKRLTGSQTATPARTRSTSSRRAAR